MKRSAGLIALLILLSGGAAAQTAPGHLRYFGFALIDVFWDDPHDTTSVTNYLTEVDTFSNIAHLAVYDSGDTILSRVAFMNSRCVLPLLHIQEVFFEYEDTNGPSGANYGLRSDYLSRWNQFKNINQQALTAATIGTFYIADEPFWTGITYNELDTVTRLLQQDYPQIPVFIVEAYSMMNQFQVPPDADWIAFDMYGVFDPPNDAQFMANLNLLKNARTSPAQKIFLIIDDQWLTIYGQAGFAPDTIEYMVQHYYDLAVADTSISGLIGYLWPGGLDEPAQLGVRDMPANVIAKNVQIGQAIKNNYNPCNPSALGEAESTLPISISPNPANDLLLIHWGEENAILRVYNSSGMLVSETRAGGRSVLDVSVYVPGIYLLNIQTEQAIYSRTFLIVR